MLGAFRLSRLKCVRDVARWLKDALVPFPDHALAIASFIVCNLLILADLDR